MDKLGRLTNWDEWELGEYYVWCKRGSSDKTARKCIEINHPEGFITLQDQATGRAAKQFNWQGRFVHVRLDP